CQQGDSTPFTF
nr:immunoglobulin light chain junction region [Macaca mulatta]MOX88804.1 immunoglobulin light chain junction region [Macaca mulatta]